MNPDLGAAPSLEGLLGGPFDLNEVVGSRIEFGLLEHLVGRQHVSFGLQRFAVDGETECCHTGSLHITKVERKQAPTVGERYSGLSIGGGAGLTGCQRGLVIYKLEAGLGGKVPADDGLLFKGRHLEVRAMSQGTRMAAKDWLDELSVQDYAKFEARLYNIDKSFETGRPTVGAFESIKGSNPRLTEFRITRKGAKAPHLRMLGVFRRAGLGGVFWAATGIKKQKDRLEKRDIQAAEAITERWQRNRGEMK